MNPVPWKYRNVVNPWQSPKEIRLATRFIDRMVKRFKLSGHEELALLRAEQPDRRWQ
jgi:hypothetical protein